MPTPQAPSRNPFLASDESQFITGEVNRDL